MKEKARCFVAFTLALLITLSLFAIAPGVRAYAVDPVRPPGEGTEAGPFLISTAAHMVWVRDNHSYWEGEVSPNNWQPRHFRLENNNLELPAGFMIGTQWTDGGQPGQWRGNFNGNGNSITVSLTDLHGQENIGLFRFIGPTGIVRNLTVLGAVEGRTAGGLAAVNRGHVLNSHAGVGSVSGHLDQDFLNIDQPAGGLIGINARTGVVESSSSVRDVNGPTAGGLIGVNLGVVRDSFATGDIRGAGTLDSPRILGGLVGANIRPGGPQPNSGRIYNSFATGNLIAVAPGANYSMGGIAGINAGMSGAGNAVITNSVALNGNFVAAQIFDAHNGNRTGRIWGATTAPVRHVAQDQVPNALPAPSSGTGVNNRAAGSLTIGGNAFTSVFPGQGTVATNQHGLSAPAWNEPFFSTTMDWDLVNIWQWNEAVGHPILRPHAAPVITGYNAPNGRILVPYSFSFVATGNPVATFSATGNFPPGLTLAPNGTLSGTPTQAGNFTFFLYATNINGTIRRTVSVEIYPGPAISSIIPVEASYFVGIAQPGLYRNAVFNITGTNLHDGTSPLIALGNFSVPTPPGNWITPGTSVLNVIDATTATLTVPLIVASNPGAARGPVNVVINNTITPAITGTLPVSQLTHPPAITSIAPNNAAAFANVPAGGVTNQNAVFNITGVNLTGLTYANFSVAGLPSDPAWITAGDITAASLTIVNAESATLTVPLTVDVNHNTADRGPVNITINNTIIPVATSVPLPVSQAAAVPTVSTIAPGAATVTAFANVPAAGVTNYNAVFNITGTGLAGIGTGAVPFSVVASSLPAWASVAGAPSLSDISATGATLTIPFTVESNPGTARGPVNVTINNTITPAVNGTLVVGQEAPPPVIASIIPTPATGTTFGNVPVAGATNQNAVFTITGENLSGLTPGNFSVATLPAGITAGTHSLSDISDTGATLTVPLTIAANNNDTDRNETVTINNTIPNSTAVTGTLQIIQDAAATVITSIVPTDATVTAFANVAHGGATHNAVFNIVGTGLNSITFANFDAASGLPTWVTAGTITSASLTNVTATGAVLTVSLAVLPNTGAARGPENVTINTTIATTPADVAGVLPVSQQGPPPVITSITPTPATETAFTNVPAVGLPENAVFTISGSNLTNVTAANLVAGFSVAGLPSDPVWITAQAHSLSGITDTSATLTVPLTVSVNNNDTPRPQANITINNTFTPLETGSLTITQVAAVPTVTSITPETATVAAFANVSAAGGTQNMVFNIAGTGLNSITAANFSVADGLPGWLSEGTPLPLTNVTPTGATLTVPLTVAANEAISGRGPENVTIDNTITTGVTGTLAVSQAGVAPTVASITPTEETVAAFTDVAYTGVTNQSAVFTVAGTNLHEMTAANFSVAAGLPEWISAGTISLSGVTTTGAALTVSLTVSPNTIVARGPENVVINNTLTPAITGVLPVNQVAAPVIPPPAVTNLTMPNTFGQAGVVFDLNERVVWHPASSSEGRSIRWYVADTQPANLAPGAPGLGAAIANGNLTVTGAGRVRVRAFVSGGGANGANIERFFDLTFSAESIAVTVYGLETLHRGRPVSGRVIFTLEGGSVFADEIFPGDFTVSGLPLGLRAGDAFRVNNHTVVVPIFGEPGRVSPSEDDVYALIVPASVPVRNIRDGTFPVVVTGREHLLVGPVSDSAVALPGSVIFDLNEFGELHRDVHIAIDMREQDLRGIFYGAVELREGIDFIREGDTFTIRAAFLARLPVGSWDLLFQMRQGANPVVTLVVIDTAGELPPPPPIDPGPAPTPPPRLPSPDMNFMYLTGNMAIDVNALNWNLGRARVNPQVLGGRATVTVRTHVLDYLSWRLPGQSFEINTPFARLSVPTELLDIIFGGRAAIINQQIGYDQVDLRISLIDRTDYFADRADMFRAAYPNGQILTPLVELHMELICVRTGVIFFVVDEFTRPLDKTFVVMGTASHLRPAGMFFHPARVEFAPYRIFTPNEITVRSIFTGVHGVVHNNAFFEDIPRYHWGYEQAYTAAYSSLVAYIRDLNFNEVTTRGEFVQLLANTLQLPRAGIIDSGYVDIPWWHPFFDGISRARAAGLLGLWNGDYFSPNAPISRQEIAAIVGAATLVGQPELQPDFRPIATVFIDSELFSAHHLPAVQSAINFSIVTGHPDGSFRPLQSATRVETLEAVINLARVMGLLD